MPGLHRVGFVGIGNMGLPMALRLLEAGHEVRVRDLDAGREFEAQAAGALACATPAAVAAASDCVIVAVVDGAQTEDVLLGTESVAAAAHPGLSVMLCPTIAPEDTERFAARLGSLGVPVIDAPMSGGPARARDGTMSLMVACADEVFARHEPLLRTLSSRVVRLGERIGDGARTKLVNNLLAAVNLAGAAEALALAATLGLDPQRTLEVIAQSSGQSWIGVDRLQRALSGDTAVHAHAALLAKDSALACAMARAAGVELPLGEQARGHFAALCAAGLRDADDSALYRWLLEQRAASRSA
jgi:3-hydroxyisobutyrate dehydrogenase